MNKLVQDIELFDNSSGFTGFGPLGLEGGDPGKAPSLFATLISTGIGIITVVAIIWFVFQFLIGAIAIISSGGDKAALETAKKKITTGLIGLVVTIFAIFLIRLFGTILGIPNILNFVDLFTSIQLP